MSEHTHLVCLSNIDCFYLDAFFKQKFKPSCRINLPKLHGLLTAVVSAPNLVKPSEWAPIIFGQNPEFDDISQAERVMRLVIDVYSCISRQLRQRQGFELLLWNGEFNEHVSRCDESLLAQWCTGYLEGTLLDPSWGADSSALAMLTPFSLLAKKQSFIGCQDSEGRLIETDNAFIEDYRIHLKDFIEDNYGYWQSEREEELKQKLLAKRRKAQFKMDCPCGSRLAFEYCCYEPQAVIH